MEKAKKQSKFKHYILTPFRIMKKAKDLYVKGVVDCAGALGVGVSSSVQMISQHPQSQSQSQSQSQTQNRSCNKSRPNGQRENVGHQTQIRGERIIVPPIRNETRAAMHKRKNVGYRYNRMKMSYHTELRKMETIDEDKPCYFEEHQNGSNSKQNLLYLYPRTRLCVVHSRH